MREFAGLDALNAQPIAAPLAATIVGNPETTLNGVANGVPWGVVAAIGLGSDLPQAVQSVQSAPAVRAVLAAQEQPAEANRSAASGMSLLNVLAGRSAASLTTFLTGNPTAVRSLLASPPTATEVGAWWGHLDAGSRSALLDASPLLVGNLDGIPLESRGMANQRLLDQSAQAVGARLESTGRGERFGAEQQLVMFSEVEKALEPAASGERRTLLSFDPEGAGTAAIVIGDLAAADYVSVLVPGAFVLVSGQIVQWTDSAQALHDERTAWVDRVWTGAEQPSVATIAWVGYQTPGPFEVTKLDLAGQGRDALASVIQGVQAERVGSEPYLSVIAHSYGSTASMMALTEYEFEIDALAVVGSPGGLVSSADDLHVRNGDVYVGDAPWDPVAGVGFFGVDPGSPQFGAKSFGVSGGRTDPYSGLSLGSSMMHDSYFNPGSESLRNLALISLGLGDRVTQG